MGAYYDIYGFSKNRDLETIDTFLNHYTYRNEIEVWKDSEIQVWQKDKYNVEETLIPVDTLTEVIQYGLTNKNHGFVFYLGSKGLKYDIESVILKFTYDSAIIFGLSIEEKLDGGHDNYKRAYELEQELKRLIQIDKSSIQFEYAPANDKEEFEADIKLWEEMNRQKLEILHDSTQ